MATIIIGDLSSGDLDRVPKESRESDVGVLILMGRVVSPLSPVAAMARVDALVPADTTKVFWSKPISFKRIVTRPPPSSHAADSSAETPVMM
jgi:hypothetical protein